MARKKIIEPNDPNNPKARVELELKELVERQNKLFDFIHGEKIDKLKAAHKELLNIQLFVMNSYISVLEARLNLWEGN